MDFLILVLFLFLGSVGSVSLASLLLTLHNKALERIATLLMYSAGGTLLGAAFLGMIPNAIHQGGLSMLSVVLAGIIFFFVIEKVILWRVCHQKDCERHFHAAAPLILVGDAFHNAIDGIIIAASFLTSVEVGLFVTFSVMFHEIPQELADFGILIKSGYSKRKAILANLLSGATAMITGMLSYFVLDWFKQWIPYVLAFSAASFLYIALADLIPEMHKETAPKESFKQLLSIGLGVLVIIIAIHNH